MGLGNCRFRNTTRVRLPRLRRSRSRLIRRCSTDTDVEGLGNTSVGNSLDGDGDGDCNSDGDFNSDAPLTLGRGWCTPAVDDDADTNRVGSPIDGCFCFVSFCSTVFNSWL